jgi:hypothetical protein
MTKTTITEEKFNSIARSIQEQLRGATGANGKAFGLSKSRQIASQSLFSKPYEEIKETVLKTNGYDKDKVHLLIYGHQNILTFNGQYFISTGDVPMSSKDILARTSELAELHNVDYKVVNLPQILDHENCENDDIIHVANQMGYFNYDHTIFDLIEDADTTIIIDGEFSSGSLNDDWEGELANTSHEYFENVSENGGILDNSHLNENIWSPVLLDGTELNVTFKELCDARHVPEDDHTWRFSTELGQLLVSFKR